MACCRLRVKDVDFGMNQLMIRGCTDDKDRSARLTERLKPALSQPKSGSLEWLPMCNPLHNRSRSPAVNRKPL